MINSKFAKRKPLSTTQKTTKKVPILFYISELLVDCNNNSLINIYNSVFDKSLFLSMKSIIFVKQFINTIAIV